MQSIENGDADNRPHQAKIISIACSQAPEGFAKWSMRMIADVFEATVCMKCSNLQA
jgi:hypothetical protein